MDGCGSPLHVRGAGSRADTPALSAQELSKALEVRARIRRRAGQQKEVTVWCLSGGVQQGGLKGRGWAVSSDGKTLSKTFVTADFGEGPWRVGRQASEEGGCADAGAVLVVQPCGW